MKEVSILTQGSGSVPSPSTKRKSNEGSDGSPPAPRELVLYDVLLKNGDRVAEGLSAVAARSFVRVWNRLPRPEHERARTLAVRWRPVQRK